MLNILWNVYRFPLPYMLLDKFDITKTGLDRNSLRPEDKWILSRVNSLAREVQNYTDIYQLHRTTRALASFILEDLSRWYIQLVRPRTWTETDDPDKLAAYATIYEVMATLIKLMAPFTPYLAESIYQNLVKGMDPEAPESVHMCDWPSPREDLIDGSLEEMMQTVRDISESVANARQKAGRKLRWPVSEIIIAPDKEIDISGLEGVLLSQTNSKKITVLNPGGKPEMVLELQPVPRRIGPVFKGEAQRVIEALKKSDPVEMKRSLEAGGYALNVDGKTYQIASDMVEFREILPEKLWATKFSSGAVYVDVELTSELEREGYAREMIRRIQDMRKELDLRVEDKIEVAAKVTDQEVSALMLKLKDYIKGEVRASKLEIGDDISVRGSLIKEWKVEDTLMLVGIGVSRTGGEPE
jgi:isoleucyl-tRNA synthetase